MAGQNENAHSVYYKNALLIPMLSSSNEAAEQVAKFRMKIRDDPRLKRVVDAADFVDESFRCPKSPAEVTAALTTLYDCEPIYFYKAIFATANGQYHDRLVNLFLRNLKTEFVKLAARYTKPRCANSAHVRRVLHTEDEHAPTLAEYTRALDTDRVTRYLLEMLALHNAKRALGAHDEARGDAAAGHNLPPAAQSAAQLQSGTVFSVRDFRLPRELADSEEGRARARKRRREEDSNAEGDERAQGRPRLSGSMLSIRDDHNDTAQTSTGTTVGTAGQIFANQKNYAFIQMMSSTGAGGGNGGKGAVAEVMSTVSAMFRKVTRFFRPGGNNPE
eukprot:192821_1